MHYIPTNDLSTPELALFNTRAETHLMHYFEPEPGLFIAETPMVVKRALEAGYEPMSVAGEERILKENEDLLLTMPKDTPVYVSTSEILSEIAGYKLARGLMCAMRRRALSPAEEIIKSASRIVLLEDVENPTNVGAIFRSAAALGMDGVLLTKGCADPLYRRASRVSMGTVFSLPWTYYDNRLAPAERVELLKQNGYKVLAMALTEDSVPLNLVPVSPEDKVAVIMGFESTGICEETLKACDLSVIIPMQNGVDSLNVAAASAVAFWELGKRSAPI